ncbi:Amidase 1 [Geodia barretti]|uniref:Amidase 1 n=1 Tax=Geodia barretti TaxID=519541 RepID=A0AA35QYZ7_GEOBA|nr:Amidase 1 [Geodia barretti]
MIQNPHPNRDALNAFCSDDDTHLPGGDGPLSGLTFASKDIFDVAGHITTGGNPAWKATHAPAEANAWVVQQLVDAGAELAGKTITDELTRGIFGENVHYGTPVNPRARDGCPAGLPAGGSVRVPASFCGLYGLRPTHGRIPRTGMMLQAPSYDTIGWFARDAETFGQVGKVLLASSGSPGVPLHLIIAEDAFELAESDTRSALMAAVEEIGSLFDSVTTVRLSLTSLTDWSNQQQVLQSREAWESVREWIDRVNPAFSFEVSDRYVLARSVTDEQVAAAQLRREEIVARMNEVFQGGEKVVCLPTTISPAPPTGQAVSQRHELRLRNSAITSIAGNTGRPQISLPLVEVGGLPVGLSLLGDRGADEALISLASRVAGQG